MLQYAVNYNRRELVTFLLNEKADPDVEDKDSKYAVRLKDIEYMLTRCGRSATSLAWGRILRKQAPADVRSEWLTAFADEEYLASLGLKSLHKVVLGLKHADLVSLLELSTAGVDDVDSQGLTALSWAASRCDLQSIKVLLAYGADPNIYSYENTSPLQFACQAQSGNVGGVCKALLDAGANVNHVDSFQRTALTYGACNQSDPASLRPILDSVVDIDHPDKWCRTPLGYAARMGLDRTVTCLLKCSADPNAASKHVMTPLMEAIEGNHHACIRVLLGCSKNEPAVLSTAARKGDVETMRLLAERGHDESDQDWGGLQASLEARFDVSDQLRRAWHALKHAGRSTADVQQLDDSDDENDEFYDAD